MRKSKLISSVFTFLSVLGFSSSLQAQIIDENYQFVEGDVLIQKQGFWKALKVLSVEKSQDNSLTLHAMIFEDSNEKPTMDILKNSAVKIYHVPIVADEFKGSWELLGNSSVKKGELKGFVEYLKHTNFQRYSEFTNQSMDELISLANSKYKEGYALSQQSKFKEAIASYYEAVDIFPMFIEAIDNIAFAYMDMGDNENAIKYFDKSLEIDPNGVTAFYYKGQCYINLRDRDSAMAIFKEGMTRFPEKKSVFEDIYLQLKNMRSNG